MEMKALYSWRDTTVFKLISESHPETAKDPLFLGHDDGSNTPTVQPIYRHDGMRTDFEVKVYGKLFTDDHPEKLAEKVGRYFGDYSFLAGLERARGLITHKNALSPYTARGIAEAKRLITERIQEIERGLK